MHMWNVEEAMSKKKEGEMIVVCPEGVECASQLMQCVTKLGGQRAKCREMHCGDDELVSSQVGRAGMWTVDATLWVVD